MCHVSDLCASSPWPLDQTVIRSMVEIEWSCASLHASMDWGGGARGGRFLHGSSQGPAACCPFCVDVVTAAPAGVDYIGLYSLWNLYFLLWVLNIANDMSVLIVSTSSSQWSAPNIFLRLFCYERKFEHLLFLIFAKLYRYYLISFDAHFGISCKTSL